MRIHYKYFDKQLQDLYNIDDLLADDGYDVYKVGKWHLGGDKPGSKGPLGFGFTKEFGIYSGGSNHWNNLAMTPDFQDPDGLNKKRVEEWTLNGEPYDRPEGVYSGEIYKIFACTPKYVPCFLVKTVIHEFRGN